MTKSIERAQRRVELQNFEARKRLLEYDDVMNQQREVIYDLRLFGLEGGEDLKGEAWEMIERSVIEIVESVIEPGSHADEWDLSGLRQRLLLDYFLVASFLPTGELNPAEIPWKDTDELMVAVLDFVHEAYHEKIDTFGENWERILSFIVLSVIDEKWKGHLYDLDHLRESIRYRAYGQRDPLVEYKKEAYGAFVDLMQDLRKSLSNLLFRAQVEMRPALRPQQVSSMSGPSELAGTGSGAPTGRAGIGFGSAAAGRGQGRDRGTGRDGCGGHGAAAAGGEADAAGPAPRSPAARRGRGGTQRSVSVREREEVQEVPREAGVTLSQEAARARWSLLAA